MRIPADEDLREYEAKLDRIRASIRADEDTAEQAPELTAFMVKTGIAEEAPATDRPELSDAP